MYYTKDVAQGSILGPVLSLIFIRHIVDVKNKCDIHLFDDV